MRERYGVWRIPPYGFEVVPLHDVSPESPPCGCLFHVSSESIARAHVAEHNLIVGTEADPYFNLRKDRPQLMPLTDIERERVDDETIAETWLDRRNQRIVKMGRAFARQSRRAA